MRTWFGEGRKGKVRSPEKFKPEKKFNNNLVEAHCYGIGRTGQIFEQSRSSEETDRNVDVSTAKVFVSTIHCTDEDLRGRNVYISICFFTAT